MEIKYGIISDVHQDPRIVPLAIEVLKKEGAKKLIVNGDIGGHYGDLQNSQKYTAFILDAIGKSGLESFVQPGSHETLLGYGLVIDHFTEKHKGQVIDCLKNPKVENAGHSLVFLPGSDFLCGGEYQIGNMKELPSGDYIHTKQGLMEINSLEMFVEALGRGIAQSGMHYINMNDLKKLVNYPEKTIVVCHVPRKFNGLETCVDMAEFGEASIDFLLNGNLVTKGSVFPLSAAQKISRAGYPVAIKKENRGNEDLQKLYGELGITKAISGHFHESVHRANNLKGEHVNEGEMVDELFWMASYLDGLKAGILTVDDSKVNYRNIDLRDVLNM